MKRRGNDRFHVVSTWNPRGVFVGQKAVQSTDISLEIIKENADKFGSYLCELFSDCIDKGIFPNILKYANIMSVFKIRYRGCALRLVETFWLAETFH